MNGEHRGLSAALGGFVAMAVVGLLAWGSGASFLAPPLGATALLCFQLPLVPGSSPRNIVYGHTLGLGCGWLALWVTGALGQPSALVGIALPNVAAAALALLGTMLLMNLFDCVHPPAGATTLVVSLGLLHRPLELAALQAGGFAVAATAFLCHRLRGIEYPYWAPRDPDR